LTAIEIRAVIAINIRLKNAIVLEERMMRKIALSGCAFVFSVFAGTALADPDPSSGYFQGWDDSTNWFAQNWIGNTSLTSVAIQSSGGASGGYLKSFAANAGGTFDIGAKTDWPLSGNYGGNVWTVSADLKLISGNFDNAWLRYRYSDSRYNGWVKQLTNVFAPGDWFSVSATIDQSWTDAQARANGWVPDNEVLFGTAPPTWGVTMSNVYTTEIRFSGSGSLEAGIDNFRLSSLQPTAPVPEPETYAMMLAGLGLLGVMARRRKQKAVA
jgi:hypothetical protein